MSDYIAGPVVPPASGKWIEDKDHNKAGPVKAACLSCRQKKAKCDGQRPVCTPCASKSLECIYIKSKRGGARKKKSPAPAPKPLGLYLKKLDGLLAPAHFDLHHALPTEIVGNDTTSILRTFASREEILRCYYGEVHPYLTVQPPRHLFNEVLETLLPESPFILAVQTILTLVPHPLDQNPRSKRSRLLRSAASAELGRKTIELVDKLLAEGQMHIEIVQALCALCVWEWGSTCDSETSMKRITNAIQLMYRMGVPEMDRGGKGFSLEGIDWQKDRLRRTWYVAYTYQLSLALVSGFPPPLSPVAEFHVDFPICSERDRTWSTWVNCIRECAKVCGMVNELVYMPAMMGTAGNETPEQAEIKRRKLIEGDRQIAELIRATEKASQVEHVPGGEEEVAKNQQVGTRYSLAVAHIHIHRQQAFPEVALFSTRVCDFPVAPQSSVDSQSGGQQSPPSSTAGGWLESEVSVPGGYPGTEVSSGAASSTGHYSSGQPDNAADLVSQMSLSNPSHAWVNFNPKPSVVDSSSVMYNEALVSIDQMMTAYNNNGQSLPADQYSRVNNRLSMDFRFPGHYPVQLDDPVLRFEQPAAPNTANAAQWEEVTEDMWIPEEYPTNLPAPWFSERGGATALYTPVMSESKPAPIIELPSSQSQPGASSPQSADGSISNTSVGNASADAGGSTAGSTSAPSNGNASYGLKHKAWGVDANGNPEDAEEPEQSETFPPGISLARCSTAAHAIVRLEVMNCGAALALDGVPKWIPFCSCGLVSGAYAFLLLILAVQAENQLGEFSQARVEEVESLLTSVKILVAGLEAYGMMWQGIDCMADEVRAAVQAAESLPSDVRSLRSQSHDGSVSNASGQL